MIYERRESVDYIVFCTDYYFEIIGVADIPEILKLLPYPYEVHSVPMNIISVTYGTSIPLAIEDKADCEE